MKFWRRLVVEVKADDDAAVRQLWHIDVPPLKICHEVGDVDLAADHIRLDIESAWKIWYIGRTNPAKSEHRITSRATDKAGQIQPALDDPQIARKHTFWESNGQVTR
jgi:hypothetical protein